MKNSRKTNAGADDGRRERNNMKEWKIEELLDECEELQRKEAEQ